MSFSERFDAQRRRPTTLTTMDQNIILHKLSKSFNKHFLIDYKIITKYFFLQFNNQSHQIPDHDSESVDYGNCSFYNKN